MTTNKLTNMSTYNSHYVKYSIHAVEPRRPYIPLFSVGGRVMGINDYCAIVGHPRSVLAVFMRRLARSSQGSRCSG